MVFTDRIRRDYESPQLELIEFDTHVIMDNSPLEAIIPGDGHEWDDDDECESD